MSTRALRALHAVLAVFGMMTVCWPDPLVVGEVTPSR